MPFEPLQYPKQDNNIVGENKASGISAEIITSIELETLMSFQSPGHIHNMAWLVSEIFSKLAVWFPHSSTMHMASQSAQLICTHISMMISNILISHMKHDIWKGKCFIFSNETEGHAHDETARTRRGRKYVGHPGELAIWHPDTHGNEYSQINCDFL